VVIAYPEERLRALWWPWSLSSSSSPWFGTERRSMHGFIERLHHA
jgi:hypothetical protein